MNKLEKHELHFIAERERSVDSFYAALDKIPKFKVGDFLIAYYPLDDMDIEDGITTRHLHLNKYGKPQKYIVVSVDKYGVSYIKELNKDNKPFGKLLCTLTENWEGLLDLNMYYEFQIDPEYEDSIIMDSESEYDPNISLKELSKLEKDIRAHNDAIRFVLDSELKLLELVKSQSVGDTYYKSYKSFFTILSLVENVKLTPTGRVRDNIILGVAQDHTGKKFNLMRKHLWKRPIYSSRPRSFAQETRNDK